MIVSSRPLFFRSPWNKKESRMFSGSPSREFFFPPPFTAFRASHLFLFSPTLRQVLRGRCRTLRQPSKSFFALLQCQTPTQHHRLYDPKFCRKFFYLFFLLAPFFFFSGLLIEAQSLLSKQVPKPRCALCSKHLFLFFFSPAPPLLKFCQRKPPVSRTSLF